MKTTKRSKMLLSSIAMLLVALVALGSATYAWYKVNQSVSASTTQIKAAASDGLVIRKTTNDTWTNAITNLASSSTAAELSPATINYGANRDVVTGGHGVGTSVADGTLDGTLTGITNANIDSSTTYFLVDDFYVASTGSQRTDVTIKALGSTITDSYMNIAIYVDNVYKGTVSSEDSTTTNRISDPVDTNVTLVPVTAAGATVASNVTIASNANDGNGSHVQIIAFADGENEKCTSNTANLTTFAVTYQFSYA